MNSHVDGHLNTNWCLVSALLVDVDALLIEKKVRIVMFGNENI